MESLNRYHDFTRTMAINYFAPVQLLLSLIPQIQQNKGQIINISTINTSLIPLPYWAIEEDKQQMIAGHIREEKELLMRMKRRKTVSKVIGAIAASFALFLIAYQVVISMESPSVQSAQIKNEPVSPGTTAAGTAEQKAKVTTINPQIQAYVEEALNKTNQVYSPESMTVIVRGANGLR